MKAVSNHGIMKVNNHKAFAVVDYASAECPFHQLGDVVINHNNEIGVIIQIHCRGEYRTDMFGNVSKNEISMANQQQIATFRADIMHSLKRS